MRGVLALLLCIVVYTRGQEFLSVRGGNLTLNGEKVFLSGMNQAWWTYANDFGNGSYANSRPHFIQTLNAIQAAGGNSMRIWIHIDGSHNPLFNSSGYATGLAPCFLDDLQDLLDQGQQRNILIIFTLWNCAVLNPTDNIYGLITDESKLQSYINQALVPMVRFLKTQRALGMWEIINEPEGCIQPETKSSEPCYDTSTLHFYDFSDWTHGNLPLQQLLRFIALQAAAIHTEDPKALVTVGSWTYKSVTNQLDRRNFYSDQCLQHASGGLSGARLDLFQIHTYTSVLFYFPHDPFMVNASVYKFDKPVIIGEFSQKKGGFMTSPEQYTWAYDHGYSGAWAWCALAGDDASDSVAVMQKGIGSIRDKDDQTKGGRVDINLQNSIFSSVLKNIWGFFSKFPLLFQVLFI